MFLSFFHTLLSLSKAKLSQALSSWCSWEGRQPFLHFKPLFLVCLLGFSSHLGARSGKWFVYTSFVKFCSCSMFGRFWLGFEACVIWFWLIIWIMMLLFVMMLVVVVIMLARVIFLCHENIWLCVVQFGRVWWGCMMLFMLFNMLFLGLLWWLYVVVVLIVLMVSLWKWNGGFWMGCAVFPASAVTLNWP